MIQSKPVTPAAWSDTDDAPALDGKFFERADEFAGEPLESRGSPKSDCPKLALTGRYEPGWCPRSRPPAWAARH